MKPSGDIPVGGPHTWTREGGYQEVGELKPYLVPSAEDLDAVADEEKAKEATE